MRIGDKTKINLFVVDTGATNLNIATVFVDVRDWIGEKGRRDYMHQIRIDNSITGEEVVIFKAGNDVIKMKVDISGNICRLVVKKNNDIIFNETQTFKTIDIDHTLSPDDFS